MIQFIIIKLLITIGTSQELREMLIVGGYREELLAILGELFPNNEHQVSEGDTDVVRSFELKTTEFLDWLK